MTIKKILHVHWKNPDAYLQVKQKWETSSCQHRYAELDVTSRTVLCAQCGERIDAFDYLLDTATQENSLFRNIESLELTKKKLQRDVLTLKKILNLLP